MTTPSQIDVVDNREAARYEITVNGELAGIEEYSVAGEVVSFNHTEIFTGREGLGLAATLVGRALDDLRSRGLKVRPICPYVVRFLEKHPEYQDLVA